MADWPETPDDRQLDTVARGLAGFFDAAWYAQRYPDVIASGWEPLRHYLTNGAAEGRDPNAWFDGAWYREHYPDVAASGLPPLLHYLQIGAAALRNPHPRFDAAWYVAQHPEAAGNPLVHHVRDGAKLGFPTEPAVAITNYLLSNATPFACPPEVAVDVIIPVYRGLTQTRTCLESVLADPHRPPGRIIVVDDCSPEPGLSAWLDGLAARRTIERMRNRQNRGFVASANRGMAAAGTHDVVLLNSDTEVPPGWLRRLAAQAYAAPRIASVSPFSNNATICSYPGNQGGPLPLGLSLNELDALCQTVNAGRSVEVPTTVGFCMYIRRAALREAGAFDVAGFGRGYGEENDFCRRTAALGWRHVLACDTFVYHEGGVSFGDEYDTLTQSATRLLLERYPDYLHLVSRHVATDEAGPYRFAMTAAAFRQSGRPTILLVSHALGGGVRRHILSLVERLTGQANFLLLAATTRGAALSVPALEGHPALVLPEERLDDMLTVLRGFAVTRVHIHHLMARDLDIRALVQRLDVPFDTTVHDYYAICPQVNLLPWPELPYCGEPDIGACNACISCRPSHYAREILSWRLDQVWQFLDADRVFCPSQDVKDRLQRHGLGERTIVVPHEPANPGPWPLSPVRLRGGALRVALLGVLANHKGAPAVAALAEAVDPAKLELHLIGYAEDHVPRPATTRIRTTGAYQEGELPGLLDRVKPHVLWFPSPWPETYSFTLSAAIDSGLPIVATRTGAFPERLAGRPLTWLVDPLLSTEAWLSVFDTVRATLRGASFSPSPRGLGPRGEGELPGQPDFYRDKYLTLSQPRTPTRKPARPRVLIIPERLSNGAFSPCAYIRLIQPLHHLSRDLGFDLVLGDLGTALHGQADVIATQRYAIQSVADADALAARAHATGAVLLYDLDDDLVNIPDDHPEAALLRPRAAVVRRMLRHADQVWVSGDNVAASVAITRRGDPPLMLGTGPQSPAWAEGKKAAVDGGPAPAMTRERRAAKSKGHRPSSAKGSDRIAVARSGHPLLSGPSDPAATDGLADHHRRIQVIPNGLDERLWGEPPQPRLNRFDPVRMLYMGTATHDADLAMILPALGRIKQTFGDRVSIELMGVTLASDLPGWISRVPMPAMAAASYPGFVNWITDQPGWEIGLAPLTDTPFNRCKSSIKTLDYAALGVAVLASDMPAYRGSLADGPGGMLIRPDEAAWHDAIAGLLRNAPMRHALAVEARQRFLEIGTLAAQQAARRRAWVDLVSCQEHQS